MFSEILKIIPRIDKKELDSMQRTLTNRFTKVAKTFGKGMVNVFKGGGWLGAAVAVIDRIINPLKEVQESMDRTLKASDDIATNANQFNTQTGKLFKLVKLAQATGLDQDNLFQLITKFQTAVAQAKANPNDPNASSVRNYVNQPDTVEGFFGFIQQLQKMAKTDQLRVQEQVFGEKQILRMADFLQTDFSKKLKEVGLDKVSSDKFTRSIERLAGLNDMADAMLARRESEDILQKSQIITGDMIKARDQQERVNLQRENERIKSYSDLAKISTTVDKILILFEEGLATLGKLIGFLEPTMNKLFTAIDTLMKSPMVRGIKGIFGGKEK